MVGLILPPKAVAAEGGQMNKFLDAQDILANAHSCVECVFKSLSTNSTKTKSRAFAASIGSIGMSGEMRPSFLFTFLARFGRPELEPCRRGGHESLSGIQQ
jgi:hypothetical protein